MSPHGWAALFVFFLLLFFPPALSVYDPLHPPDNENFDPAEANPEGALYCLGNLQEVLVLFGMWNPNSHDLNQLCRKPQYQGGENRGCHAVGCFRTLVAFLGDTSS